MHVNDPFPIRQSPADRADARLAFAALAFINGGYTIARREMPDHLRAVLMVRIRDAIRGGERDLVEIALSALRAEGIDAHYAVKGEIGTIEFGPLSAGEPRGALHS